MDLNRSTILDTSMLKVDAKHMRWLLAMGHSGGGSFGAVCEAGLECISGWEERFEIRFVSVTGRQLYLPVLLMTLVIDFSLYNMNHSSLSKLELPNLPFRFSSCCT